MSSQSVIPSCYRHPERETRLACTHCERPVCVECVRPAAVGQRCPECAGAGQQRVMDMDDVRRKAARAAPVSRTLLGLCLALFSVSVLVALARKGGSVEGLALLDLEGRFAQINENVVGRGEWWRLLTSAFLHSGADLVAIGRLDGLMHIGFNMYALHVFGPPLEREVGSAPFAALYLVSAVVGGVVYFLLVPQGIAVGASGAIFGLFGAWLVASYRGRHTAAGRASLQQLLSLLAINAVIGFLPALQIAWQAHLGGLIGGALITAIWARPVMQERTAARTAAALGVGLVALALAGVI